MKIFVLLLAGLTITTLSCKKSDDVAPAATPATIDVKSTVQTGNWSVSVYRQRTEDKTSDFKGMSFVFSTDGTLTVTQGNKTSKGTWASSPGGVVYYGGNPLASLTINMGTSKPFDSLSKTWNVNPASTSPDLKLDNKEPVEDEHLEFVK